MLFCLGVLVFYYPNLLSHPDNYVKANPYSTPKHIVPEWYFLPFYAILRSVPNKLLGILAMFGSILILFILPLIETSNIQGARFKPIFKIFFFIHIADILLLF
jgi:quinol-cytochrome oxidoreductase complex cytochrome b subunit